MSPQEYGVKGSSYTSRMRIAFAYRGRGRGSAETVEPRPRIHAAVEKARRKPPFFALRPALLGDRARMHDPDHPRAAGVVSPRFRIWPRSIVLREPLLQRARRRLAMLRDALAANPAAACSQYGTLAACPPCRASCWRLGDRLPLHSGFNVAMRACVHCSHCMAQWWDLITDWSPVRQSTCAHETSRTHNSRQMSVIT